MTETAAPVLPRPCSACAHHRVDAGHPLHTDLCDRLDGRLLSANAERAASAPSCGPSGSFFAAKATGTP